MALITAADVIDAAASKGLNIQTFSGRLAIEGRREDIAELEPDLITHKAAIIELLQGHFPRTKTGAILAAQRLLRENRWVREPAPCAFPIGQPSSAFCPRCEAPFREHFTLQPNPQGRSKK